MTNEPTLDENPELIVEKLSSDLVKVSIQNENGTRHTRLGSFYYELSVSLGKLSNNTETWRPRYASQVKGENIPFLHCADTLRILVDTLGTIRDPIRSLNQVGEVIFSVLDSQQKYFKTPSEVQATRNGDFNGRLFNPNEPFVVLDGLDCTPLSEGVWKVKTSRPVGDISVINLYKNICNRVQAFETAQGNTDSVWRVRHCSQVQSENFPLIHSPASLEVIMDPMAIFRSPVDELNSVGEFLMSRLASKAYYAKSSEKVFELARKKPNDN